MLRFDSSVALLVVFCLIPFDSAEAIRPREPNPTLLNVAPEDCALFFHSFGFYPPDASSTNKTEQLLADPDIQEFFDEVRKLFDVGLQKALDEAPNDEERAAIERTFAIIKKLASRPMTFYAGKIDLRGDEPKFQAGFLIDVAGLEAELKDAITSIKQQENVTQKSLTIGEIECTEIRADDAPPVYWAIDNGLFQLTVGEDSFVDLISQIRSEMPSWMSPLVKRLPIEQRGMFGFFDVKQIDKAVAAADDPEAVKFWRESGFDQLQNFALVSGLEGDGMASRALLSCDQMSGLLALLDNEGLSANDIARIPNGAASGLAVRLDPAQVFDTMVDLAQRMDPNAEANLEQFEAQAATALGGLQLRDDLIASFGDTWIVYQTGGFATMMVPDMVAVVNLKDEAKVSQALDAIVQMATQGLEAQNEATISIKKKKFGQAEGYSIRGLPVVLSFCVHNQEMIFGLSAAAIKNHLRYTPEIDKSLAVNPRLKPLLDRYEKPLLVSYSDVGKSLETMYPSVQMMLNMMSGPMSQQGFDFDPAALPPVKSITQYLEPSVIVIGRVAEGIEMEAREVMPRISGPAVAAPVAVAMLLPAVQGARAAARRAESINVAKQFGLALLNYESAQARFPSANANGLSWRVKILPYLDEMALYDQFHLDEPWDSEHNRALIKEMPEYFASPQGKAGAGKTHFLAVGGKDPIIKTGEQGCAIRDVKDGLSNTILLVEVDDDHAVTWTKPDDLDWSDDDPAKGLGGLHPGEVFVACFADGRVAAIPKTVAKDVLAAMFTKSGGEQVDTQNLAP